MMRSPEETLDRLDGLHIFYGVLAWRLIREYARGDKQCKIARDEAIGAEQVIFLFDTAVHRQIRK